MAASVFGDGDPRLVVAHDALARLIVGLALRQWLALAGELLHPLLLVWGRVTDPPIPVLYDEVGAGEGSVSAIELRRVDVRMTAPVVALLVNLQDRLCTGSPSLHEPDAVAPGERVPLLHCCTARLVVVILLPPRVVVGTHGANGVSNRFASNTALAPRCVSGE